MQELRPSFSGFPDVQHFYPDSRIPYSFIRKFSCAAKNTGSKPVSTNQPQRITVIAIRQRSTIGNISCKAERKRDWRYNYFIAVRLLSPVGYWLNALKLCCLFFFARIHFTPAKKASDRPGSSSKERGGFICRIFLKQPPSPTWSATSVKTDYKSWRSTTRAFSISKKTLIITAETHTRMQNGSL